VLLRIKTTTFSFFVQLANFCGVNLCWSGTPVENLQRLLQRDFYGPDALPVAQPVVSDKTLMKNEKK